MINEELENSLRTEVDNYFKSAFADLRQEVEQLHDSLNTEIERHRNEFEEQFKKLLTRNVQDVKVDDSFATLVSEHLKIAHDEGATAAAETYQTQLQELQLAQRQAQQPAAPADYSLLRDALNDISSQYSQSEILKAVVRHAGNFAPRGALFIVKSEHLIGWRVFGEEAATAEETVREVYLPLAQDSILSDSVNNQRIEQSAADLLISDKLGFEKANSAVAIPLIVRNRGVAALYAEAGETGTPMQIEALETLMRVASLTVELLAASKTPSIAPRQTANEQSPQKVSNYAERAQPSFATDRNGSGVAYVETPRNGNHDYQTTVRTGEVVSEETVIPGAPTEYETFSFSNAQPAEAYEDTATTVPQIENDYSNQTAAPTGYADEAEQAVAPEATPTTSVAARRFGERNVELPIEVPEEERRYHNDARRFARLLVSEIKLYNEQKVREGRAAGDLYDRLREAVDRSREMYDKRVSPLVVGKYDYFHFELINTLAEGDAAKLGVDYPGATA